MNKVVATIVEAEAGVWQVAGDIDFTSVIALSDQGCQLIAESKNGCRFDFSKVGSVNTVALSLLLNWRREAQKLGVDVEFCELPAELHAIAELSDLESLVAAPGVPISSL